MLHLGPAEWRSTYPCSHPTSRNLKQWDFQGAPMSNSLAVEKANKLTWSRVLVVIQSCFAKALCWFIVWLFFINYKHLDNIVVVHLLSHSSLHRRKYRSPACPWAPVSGWQVTDLSATFMQHAHHSAMLWGHGTLSQRKNHNNHGKLQRGESSSIKVLLISMMRIFGKSFRHHSQLFGLLARFWLCIARAIYVPSVLISNQQTSCRIAGVTQARLRNKCRASRINLAFAWFLRSRIGM